MYLYYNANPLGKNVDDCAIRALSLALHISWDEAFMATAIYAFMEKDMPRGNTVWGKVLRANGFRRYHIPDSCPDCYTIADFADDHPDGVFVVCTGTHVVTIIHGVYYDTSDCGNEVPIFYWRRE